MTAPTISDIPDQATTVNTATAAIPFTIGDADTAVASLTLNKGSSNPTLAPTNNIVFGGSGTNLTVTVTPAANQTGVATITVSVSDGTNTTSDTFVLTVNAVNTPPTITGMADQTINEDTSTTAQGFTVGDAETAPGGLTLSKGSSNPLLVPISNIAFGGTGANRTVTVSPAANQNGSVTIAIMVSDGQYAASTNFVVTVNAVNDPPTITGISNQAINVNGTTGPLNFTIGDADTTVGGLTVSGDSSNPTLVPTSNIVLGGSGTSRTVTVTPASNQVGSATIAVTVSDGQYSVSTSFGVAVSSLLLGTKSFTNTATITIPDSGAATPYPSTINVSGLGGTITNVSVTLRNLNQTWASDVDVLLVGPGGQKVVLMSDAGNGAANNVTLTLSDAAAAALPVSGLVSGSFRPTNYTDSSPGGDNFPAPAPAAPHATALSTFNGQSANGVWSLYVFDDGPGDSGSFAGGFSLTLTTVSATGSAAPAISDVVDQATTLNTPTAAIPFTISDADTPIANLTLSKGSSNPTLVPTNNIVFGGSGTNRTVTVTPASNQAGGATITVTVSDGLNSASDTFVLMVNLANTPPTITGIADQTINEDTSTAAQGFTVGDAETVPGSLTLGMGSSNPGLVPTSNIVFGGSGANRTVTANPVANQFGAATITVSVSDGQLSASDTFVLTVNAVNDVPTISSIADQSTSSGTAVGPIGFAVGDVETSAGSLTVSGSASNQGLVPDGNIVFGGSGTNRTVTLTPAAGQTGSATITVSVSDGALSASDAFVLTVSTLPAGLVGAYGFNEGTGTTVADVSGNGNTGTASGATWTTSGRFGQALTLNGSGARVTVNDSTSLDLTAGMTLEAWVYPTAGGGWRDVIYKGADDVYYLMSSSDTGAPAVKGTSAGPLRGTTSLPLNAWTHLAGTYDGASMRLYVNGVQVASRAQTGPIATSTGVLTMGGDALYGQYFAGRIDEVRIYSRALNTSEIQIDMNTPVSAVANTAPTISDLGNQSIDEDAGTGALAFTVGDAETAAGSLTVSGSSSDTALVPNANMVFGGSGAARTIAVTPAANQSGAATITVSVSDGLLSSSDTFVLTVNPVNDAPTIGAIPSQATTMNTGTAAIPFTVNDADTPLSSLTLSGSSSNPGLAPSGNIAFGGSGSNRTATVTPATGQTGTTTITVTVSDGQLSSSTSFTLTVSSQVVGTAAFTNAASISIPSVGAGTPYPSTINVAGMEGTITNLTVTFRNISHARANDIDLLLVGPAGQKAMIFSDAGGANRLNSVTVTLSDAAATALPQTGRITSGIYKPTDYESGDVMAAPAPVGPYVSALSTFKGQTANGTWSLFVVDDRSSSQGSIAGGWSLAITTVSGAAAPAAAAMASLPGIGGVAVQSAQAITVTLASLVRDTNRHVILRVEGLPGRQYLIESSQDLVSWKALGTVGDAVGGSAFMDLDPATHSQLFYRAVEVP